MAIVTLDGGQSSDALAGQSPLYLRMLALQQLPGAPDTLVDTQLQLTLKDFYTRTTGWRQTVGPYTISAGRDLVYLNPLDQNAQLQFVTNAFLYPTLGGNTRQWLMPTTSKIIGNDSDLPTSFFMLTPDQLVLYPVPNKTYGAVLWVTAICIPTANAVTLPDIAFTHHLDTLLSGLLARMYRMPKKSWTDDGLAAAYAKEYAKGVIFWRSHAERNYSPATVPTIFPPFAGRNAQMSASAVLG